MFEEGKSNWYEVKTSVENEWLNEKLDNFNYGKYYSVLFTGNAETYLWQTKEAPKEGEKYFGHLEPTKSGKGMRFKKDKVEGMVPPEANEKQASFGESPDKQVHISRSVALNNAVLLTASDDRLMKDKNTVLEIADRFLEWLNPVSQEEKDITTLFSEKDIPNDYADEVPPA